MHPLREFREGEASVKEFDLHADVYEESGEESKECSKCKK